MSAPKQFTGVTVTCKANIYFDGKVVSHAVTLPDGSRKTLGLIYPGTFRFDTGAPERMEIISGTCRVRLAGSGGWKDYGEGSSFDIPGKSFFEIAVDGGIAEYVCSFG